MKKGQAAKQQQDKAWLSQETEHFDRLPNPALVSQRTVEVIFGVSSSTVWRWIDKGILPRPVKLARSLGWQVGALRDVLAQKGEA